MKNKLVMLLFISLAFCYSTYTYAQESVLSTGSNATGGGGNISYSVGQLAIPTITGSNGSVAQGVQQPFEISVVIGLEEAKDINLSIMVFPNPTTNFLILDLGAFNNISNLTLRYQLFDNNGKLIEEKSINNGQTSILMNELPSSTYFVKVLQDNKEIKTFKIIKNQ